jgi:hypothetical protein
MDPESLGHGHAGFYIIMTVIVTTVDLTGFK